MKFLLLNAKDREIKVEEFRKITLADYYIMLDCDCIDITARDIGGKQFGIICDDEGLLKENPILSARSRSNDLDALVGNLIFSQFNYEGEEIGLTDEEIEHLKKHIGMFKDRNGNDFPLLIMD